MVTPRAILDYARAEPFRPFRLAMASGKVFEIRHSGMIKVGKTHVLIFSFAGDEREVFEHWQGVSLTMIDLIAHDEALSPGPEVRKP